MRKSRKFDRPDLTQRTPHRHNGPSSQRQRSLVDRASARVPFALRVEQWRPLRLPAYAIITSQWLKDGWKQEIRPTWSESSQVTESSLQWCCVAEAALARLGWGVGARPMRSAPRITTTSSSESACRCNAINRWVTVARAAGLNASR